MSGITEINAPKLTTIQYQACSNNTSLTRITSLGHVQNIYNSAFWGCDHLQSVVFPPECYKID